MMELIRSNVNHAGPASAEDKSAQSTNDEHPRTARWEVVSARQDYSSARTPVVIDDSHQYVLIHPNDVLADT